MTDCLKCRYCKFGRGHRELSPSGRYGVCVFGGGKPRILPDIEEYETYRNYRAYNSPEWCPFNKEDEKKDDAEAKGCFGCNSLFVCDERFRCNRRLFMDTIEGPSGFLEVDNVLKAAPEWCPGRAPIESDKPIEEEKKLVEIHWIGSVSGKTEIGIDPGDCKDFSVRITIGRKER